MQILQICNKSPYPPKEGGSIAMDAITQVLLSAGYKVKVIAMSTPKLNISKIDLPELYINQTNFEYCYVDTNVKILPALKCFITGESYNVKRFKSKKFSSFLEKILKRNRFDIIQLETVYMAPYVDIIRSISPNSIIILRAHNVEHLIWERNAEFEKNIFKKFYLSHLSKTLKKYELNVLKKFNGIATITDIDRTFFNKYVTNTLIKTIPFNISDKLLNKQIKSFNKRSLTLFHIGSMDWLPNTEGIKWFLNNIWNMVRLKDKNIVLELAGRNMPKWIYNFKDERIKIHGEVKDAINFMESRQIMIVPLLSGSGVRIKILEGMASGNVIITTSVGAEGINCTNKKNILIADTPKEFAESIFWCLNNQEKLDKISEEARNYILKNHTMQSVADNIITFYKELIANKNSKDYFC